MARINPRPTDTRRESVFHRAARSDTTTTLITPWGFEARSGSRVKTFKEYHGKKGHWIREAADSCRQGEPGAPRRYGSRTAGNQHHGLLQRVQRSDAGTGCDSPG